MRQRSLSFFSCKPIGTQHPPSAPGSSEISPGPAVFVQDLQGCGRPEGRIIICFFLLAFFVFVSLISPPPPPPPPSFPLTSLVFLVFGFVLVFLRPRRLVLVLFLVPLLLFFFFFFSFFFFELQVFLLLRQLLKLRHVLLGRCLKSKEGRRNEKNVSVCRNVICPC